MAAGTGNLQGALRGVLAANILEIDQVVLGFAEQRVPVDFHRCHAIPGIDEVDHVHERFHRIHVNTAHHRRLACVELRHDQSLELLAPGLDSNGESPADSANSAIERRFADECTVEKFFLVEPAVGSQDAKRHGQVEPGAFLADIGGRQVHRDVSRRNVIATVAQRGTDPVLAFPDGGIREPDCVEMDFIQLDA